MAKQTNITGPICLIGLCLMALIIGSSVRSANSLLTPRSSVDKVHGKLRDGDSKTPLSVRLSMTDLPKLNETTEVTCSVSTVADSPNVVASIQLPDDALVFAGNTHWTGSLNRGDTISFSATIRFQTEGKKIVSASAQQVIDQDNVWADADTIYLKVGQFLSQQGIFSATEASEPNKAGTAALGTSQAQQPDSPKTLHYVDKGAEVPPALVYSITNESAERTVVPEGTIIVTGRWSHYDRNGVLIPSKNFLVQLRRASDGSHLSFAYTDNSGNFSLGPVTNPGSDGIKVRIWTYVKYDSSNASGDELMVVPNDSSSAYTNTYYGETNDTFVFADGTNSVGSWFILRDSPEGTQPRAHAWYIKDDLDRGWRYPLPSTVGGSTVEWQFDSNVGTYYRPGEHVHLKGEDRKSPDTIIHEFGHNLMYNVYGNTMPQNDCPDPHYVTLSSGIFCGWTEGWADFYALAVNGDPSYTWASGATLNLETPTWGTADWDNGATVEGRVAGAMWDVFDAANDGSDTLSDGFTHIWSAFTAHNNATFRHYWDDLSVSGINSTGAANAIYQNTIDYRNCTAAQMTSPSNGSNIQSTTTFTWNTGSGNAEYWIYAGTSPGAYNLYTSSQGSGTSRTLSNLPAGTIYVRLWSRCAATNVWSFIDYTYVIPNCTAAQMTSPSNGANIQSSTTFNWNTGSGNVEYWIYAGTSAGGYDIFTGSQGTNTSKTLSNLPAGTIYIRLWSRCGSTGTWSFIDYSYTRVVQTCNAAQMTSPTSGTTIQSTTTFAWNTGTNNAEFWIYAGTSSGGYDIYSASQGLNTSKTLSNLPTGTLYVRLWSRCSSTGAWSYNDYSYTRSAQTCNAAQMTNPTNGASIGSTTTFTWNAGSGSAEYWLYVGTAIGAYDILTASQGTNTSRTLNSLPIGTVYVRLWSRCGATGAWTFVDYSYTIQACGVAQVSSPTNGASIQSTTTFTWSAGSGNLEFWIYAGRSLGAYDIYTSSQGTNTSKTLTGLPIGIIYFRLWSRCGSTGAWSYKDYVYSNGSFGCNLAQITSPTTSSNINSETTFVWNTGSGNVEYWIYVGTFLGGYDIYTSSQGTNTSKTLSNLPLGTIFVRLWSRCVSTGAWNFIDYSYVLQGCTGARMISPDVSSIPSSTTFTWTTGSGNVEYWIYVGTSPGAFNIYTSSQGTNTSKTISNLPSGVIYVRLWSRCGSTGSWTFYDYSYNRTAGTNVEIGALKWLIPPRGQSDQIGFLDDRWAIRN